METSRKHVYLVGAGGVGMVWIADYVLKMGWKLSGSDANDSANVRRLQALGADIHIGTDPALIPADVTEAVMTSAATPSSPSFPEVEELRRRGVPLIKRAEWIGRLTKGKFTICVSGAHGKTTTSAMLGWILDRAGLDPTVFSGGSIRAWNNETRIGKGRYLVLEADEYDRSFHRFYPQMAIVLNIDLDHTDYYTGGIAEIEHSYRRFLRNLPFRRGLVAAYGRDPRIRKVVKGFSYRVRWYDEDHLWTGLKLPQPGLHYRLNASAAARIAHEIGVEQKVILEALATFPGVGRRWEYLGRWERAELYDDYAHHPRELQALMRGLRERFPKERMAVVFQPHQKKRTQELLKDFARAFDGPSPDQLILAPIYFVAGRESGIEISIRDVEAEMRRKELPFELKVADTLDELEPMLREAAATADVLVTVGAGDIAVLTDRWRHGR